MRISFANIVEQTFAGSLKDRALPVGRFIDSILYGDDDRAVSRRLSLVTFAIRIVSAIIAYVSQVLLARWMGSFEYGIFVVVWVAAVIIGGLAGLGVQTALLRFIPEYTQRGELALLRGVLIGSRVQGAVASTVIALLGGLGLWAFGDHLQSYYVFPLYLGLVTLPMLAIGELQDGTARAFNWADLSLWPTFVIRPVAIIFAMFVALQFGFAATAVTAMGASIVATWATTLGQLFFLRHRVKKTVPAGPRVYTPRAWLAVALPILLVEGFFNLLTNVDILMVGHLMDPDSVAIYFAAAKTLAVVHFVYFSVRAGSAQRFSQYSAAGDRVSLEAFVRDTLHWTFWPSLAIVLMLVVVGEPLLALFGSGFTAGYPLLFILSAGLLVRAAIGPAGTLLTMSGQQGISAIIYVFTFALNIVLTLLLIPRFGLSGAATATALSLVAESVALYVVVLSRLGIHCSILSVVGPWRTLKAS